ncbi:carotenoid 1,2-hydratase [Aquibium sp. ELW1220]|uniref:carotenoid 1,2-hydratase n=1 Tax=Aquibium sp. ELW1220 TaxID=2976766 RepID=UPI0025AFF84C|nr:carotenoid 1,2-hydratase [Aquibium sp. ELW1220]MDN2581099.1 carotenoid 1,2-hydratase [Aquibium sp. ELW1220]
MARGGPADPRLRFDGDVPPGGYAWWYVDATSDDGRHALTIIAFVGSVFSPYHAWARQRGAVNPLDHVAVNAILYGSGPGRWAMTERGAGALARAPDRLTIGPSGVAWVDGKLVIDIDEWAFPLPRRMAGRVVIDPGPLFHAVHALDARGLHRWRPVAPLARATVSFDNPRLGWSGLAYVDMNAGDEPIENGFRGWTWSRTAGTDETTIFYDVETRRDGGRGLALSYRADGTVERIAQEPVHQLPGTLWRVGRAMRSATAPTDIHTFEDTPFYTRTGCRAGLPGRTGPTVCESVDLDRFASNWVRMLLPFRMPRRR